MGNIINSEIKIGTLNVKNRLVRSATYEGASDRNGVPGPKYRKIYEDLAKNQVGMIISGFSFVSRSGRAMQTAQSGIDSPAYIPNYREVTRFSALYNCPIILQISHCGRQTLASETGSIPVSSTNKRSVYFRQPVKLATQSDIYEIISQFSNSALYAKESGFDGVQLHCGHGYLLHQFIMPDTNILKNHFGIDRDTGISTRLLDCIIDRIRLQCGDSFPVLVKISGDHDLSKAFFPAKFDELVKFLHTKRIAAIEVSYGTMDYALNIFRGDMNLKTVFKYNPLFKSSGCFKQMLYKLYIKSLNNPKLIGFSPMYNINYAERAKQLTDIPIIAVGGFRTRDEIESALIDKKADMVGLSRPFICEPDFASKIIASGSNYTSKCINCNECVFMCDSGKTTRCYKNNYKIHQEILP